MSKYSSGVWDLLPWIFLRFKVSHDRAIISSHLGVGTRLLATQTNLCQHYRNSIRELRDRKRIETLNFDIISPNEFLKEIQWFYDKRLNHFT